jgi:hypothetical protein
MPTLVLFDGGSYWKVHLLRFGLIFNISFGILTIAVRVIHHQLSHQAQESLRQSLNDLIDHGLWPIGHLIQTLTYPGTSAIIL